MFEGKGLAVSVGSEGAVDVLEAVSVNVGMRGVSVNGTIGVSVGPGVSVKAGVEVRVQASEVRAKSMKKTSVRLIREYMFLSSLLYSKNRGRKRPITKKIPVPRTGIVRFFSQNHRLVFALAFVPLLIFFFGNKRFEEHDRSCLALRALQASENMQDFLARLISIEACRQ